MYVCAECGQSIAPPAPPRCTCGGELRTKGHDHLLGRVVGSYRIAKLIGEGGMGSVYKAVHPTIGSRVAIKVLSHDCTSSPDLVERFFAEAKAANVIQHENIINILDLAVLDDGRPYIVMEYLDGASLGEIITQRGALPLGGVVRMIGEVLDALGAAHAAPIVHRDLKPDNIFISPQGRAKVLDFGIAKLRPELTGREGATKTGSLMGTPQYMSPEQALARGIDTRTDIYAMGVIVFEAVTGTRPFNADSLFELLRMHVEVQPPSPRSYRPDVPPMYEHVILRALAKDPAARFQTAYEMKHALQQAGSQLPEHAWQPIVPAAGHHASGAAPTPGSQTPPHGPPQTPPHGPPHTPPHAPPHRRYAPSPHVPPVQARQVKTGASRALLLTGVGLTLAALAAAVVISQRAPDDADDRARSALPQIDVTSANTSGAPTLSDVTPDSPATGDPDQQLAAKLSDVVPCVTDGGAYRSRARYLSWVNADRGPTGKERYISYGLYSMSDPASCAETIAKMSELPPPLPELEASLRELSRAVTELAPIVNEASEYYDQEDYKDDGAETARRLHPNMMTGFDAVQAAHTEAEIQLRNILDKLADREIARAENIGSRLTHLSMTLIRQARDLTDTFKPMTPGKIDTLDLARYKPRLTAYLDTLDKLGRALKAGSTKESEDVKDDASSVHDHGKELAKAAKLLRRKAETSRDVGGIQKDWLGTSSGWMVSGSPDSVMRAYSSLVTATWRPEFARRVLVWEVQDPRYYTRAK